jgi:hypothetical protein
MGLYRASVPVQYSYTSTPPMARTACTGSPSDQNSNNSTPPHPLSAVYPLPRLGACTVQLYLYSPYGPYCLYRASVPVQYSYTSTPPMGHMACTEPQYLYSTAIPLLPLLAVLPVQSLSACTVQLYLYSPYGPYCLYRASVPVQGCTLPYLTTASQLQVNKCHHTVPFSTGTLALCQVLCCLLPAFHCNSPGSTTGQSMWDL